VRWLADECVDFELVARLRSRGHDVVYMAEIAPTATDFAVIERAQAEARLLLTEDKDFGELVVRRDRSVPGLVLLRIDPAMRALKQKRLAAVTDRFGDALFGRYTIVEPGRFRSRRLRG
jgi:predicted nuclease of predicted toxin-antitoxin system